MRLDEIRENYEKLKAKVVSNTTKKAEQARGGQKERTKFELARSVTTAG